ncbi:hypothetical protein G9A89_000995 [Geosiphon pyriformis]|nr:hypothetical protein G9A89_000995 [Geosiphon pyriformis]
MNPNLCESLVKEYSKEEVVENIYSIFLEANKRWEYDDDISQSIINWIKTNNYDPEYLFDLILNSRTPAERGCVLALFYDYGIGVKENKSLAAESYKIAAESGDLLAQVQLGFYLQEGWGLKRDKKEAVYWYRKASDDGFEGGHNFLGICYQWGLGVTIDSKLAFEYTLKAASAVEYGEPQARLGSFYESGFGTKIDLCKAFKWYQKSAANQYLDGLLFLGTCYRSGLGTRRDIHQAIKSWRYLGNHTSLYYLFEKNIG